MLKKYAAIPFAVMCLTSQLALAEETKSLSSVVITATKTEQDSFDLPMSIDKVSKEQIQDGQLRMTLSESLARVPGITAQNRTQMAQDPQISSRGFGARSAFGVRGIRVYVDGIPLSMPDGIGNPGSVDLGMMESIEVMRGPFSAMYGNSSGGVIQMLTGKSEGPTEVTGDVLYGSYKTHRESVSVTGGTKDFDYQLSTSNFASDGYRQQSKNDKKQATAKLGVKISDDTQLTTLLNWFEQYAQDPGGLALTKTSSTPSYLTDRTGASKGAIGADSRAERKQTQIGFNLVKMIDSTNTLNAIVYVGQRSNLGYLTRPTGTNYTTGALSAIDRDFYGTELKWTNKGQLMQRAYTLVSGLNYGSLNDARTEKKTVSGVVSSQTLDRDEKQTAVNFDQYAQASWALDEKWDLHAGIRHTRLELDVNDIKNSTNNSFNFDKTIPVIGTTYKISPVLNVYANMGQGFETPTLIELTYSKTDGSGGPNTNLKSSTSGNYEIGSKWIASDTTSANVALFLINTNNEIVVDSSDSNTVYRNFDGKTKRTGFELSLNSNLGSGFTTSIAYTYLDATFENTYSYVTKVNGSNRTWNVAAGSQIPGTYKQQAFAELAWTYPAWGLQTSLNATHNSSVQVNDENTSGWAAAGYTVFNLKASLNQKLGSWNATEYVTLNNLSDVKYVGSVKVNDGNLRYYEVGAPANWIVGVKAAYKF
jgi:iron complex outermembrane receptor protein